jgi:hypothetical protein
LAAGQKSHSITSIPPYTYASLRDYVDTFFHIATQRNT